MRVMEEPPATKRPPLPARPEATYSHSAAVSYLTKISSLELVNSELEVMAQVAKTEAFKLREQVKSLKAEVQRLSEASSDATELRSRVATLLEENRELRQDLNDARAELEEVSRDREALKACKEELKTAREQLASLRSAQKSQVEEETAALQAENDLLKLELRMAQRPRSTTPLQPSKVVNVKIDTEPTHHSLTDNPDEILVQTVSLAEINDQHCPNAPYRKRDVLFASARKQKSIDQSAEEQRSMSSHKRSLSRVVSASRLGTLARYTPSSVRTVKKSKGGDGTVSHVNLPRVSEIKLTSYLSTRLESFDDYPAESDLR